MIVLDTSVVSELMRAEPAKAVVEWVGRQPPLGLFTTAVTEAEILLGVRLLARGKRRDRIEAAVRAMFGEDFAGRVLPFGSHAASVYARIASERKRAGRPIAAFDAQIAAIARCSGAAVATRNVADFEGCGVQVVDPWSSAADE